MKQDFLNYVNETFQFSPAEMQEFSESLSKPLKKTIRVNTNKISIEDFKKLVEQKSLPLNEGKYPKGDGVEKWKLTETPLGKNMFYVDRDDTSIALGNTLEHIAGYFYIQELAASSSPFYLSEDSVDESDYTILDISASPGGKTTQLAEYYPNATIIANELDKSRMRQLHENLDRLGAKNSFVTNYDGRFFKNFPETFDKILLDAPCSGEGTAYKNDDALKYWNLKNIKRIAKLQFGLLESALIALKVGGELVYSTCTLNRLENEEVINKLTDKYGDYFRIISLTKNPHPNLLLKEKEQTAASSSPSGEELRGGASPGENGEGEQHIIRSWPHKNNTGGFFVAKLIKKSIIPEAKKTNKLQKNTQGFEKVSKNDEKLILTFLEEYFKLNLSGKFYTYRDEIYYTKKNIDFFWENFFLYKVGIKVGKIENGSFIPNFFLGTNFGIFEKNTIVVHQKDLHILFSGGEAETSQGDGYFQIHLENIPAGIVKVKGGIIKSLLETRFMRK